MKNVKCVYALNKYNKSNGIYKKNYKSNFKLNSRYRDLESEVNATQPSTILHWAQAAGMKTGFVTTTRMSHATPAALYSRTASRFWECEQVRVATRGIFTSHISTSKWSSTLEL